MNNFVHSPLDALNTKMCRTNIKLEMKLVSSPWLNGRTCVSAAPACCSSRYGLALLSSFGFFVVYSLRVNLSVAMVDMLNTTRQSSTNHSGSVCPAHANPPRPKRNHTVRDARQFRPLSGNRVPYLLPDLKALKLRDVSP